MTRRAIPAPAAAVLLFTAFAPDLAAHDFWIEPSSFHPAVGSELAVSLRVGQDFRGEPVPRNPRLIQRFVLVSDGLEEKIDGLPGTDPAGIVRIRRSGLAWITYRSARTPIRLEAEKFEKYLADEGLETVIAAREKRGERSKEGREVYSRSVKSLIAAGAADGGAFDRALGLTLEIVPEKDPRRIPRDEQLPVKVLYEGKPLEGALVVALQQDETGKRIAVRTDGKGRATLRLHRRGIWLIKAVHMVPAPPETGADWESVWTSLTFEIP